MLRQERTFWLVFIGFVLLLVVAGLIAAALKGPQQQEFTYMPDESSPEAVVYNAYVAARRHDVQRFLSYFAPDVWGKGQTPPTDFYTMELERGQLEVGTAHITDDSAVVPVTLILSYNRGLFGSEVVVRQAQVTLKRENGRWYITATLPFVYPQFGEVPIPVVPLGGD